MGLCPECLIKAGFPTGVETDTGSAKQPAFVPPTVEEIAKLFPQLEILELVGKGGMGAVYKARQKQLNRFVALKILPPGIGSEPAFAERFTREAQALAQLNHPGIVTLYEFGETSGQFYFLMEFVDGVNLRQLLAGGRISAREALAVVPQICDALQFAHDQGIVHRDIKPENILLDRRGRVKVADFGLAKLVGAGNEPAGGGGTVAGSPELTESGKIMGTPNYMAPEQVEHPGEVDNRADIYALGVVFYQMLTGELPGKKIEPPSSKVQIDVRLDEVVLRALEKRTELRYQQASEVKTIVETIAQTPEAERMPQFSEKHHRAPWSQGLVLASLLCMGACLWPAFELFKQGSGSSFLVGSLLVALTIMCALFAIRGYTITADAILIRRLFWATRLPLAGLKSARFEIAATRWGIRAGNGGFFSCTGFRYNRSLGFHRVFVTDGARTVVLRYPRRIVVVSPADPEAFVRDLAILPSQPSMKDQRKTMQTMNTNIIKSLWCGAVMFAGVAACVVLAVFAILFLFKNQIILGPPDSDASSAGADWFPDWKGGGSASVDFNDPATKGGYDFVLSNTNNFVADVENYADWRCPNFSLGPAAGGARPISFSFAYKLENPVAARNNLRVQLCFWDSTGTNFLGERDIDVGAHTGDSAMTSYRTLTINGIMAPPKAQTMYIAILANINPDLLWASGTGRFANISVTTVPHSLLFKAGVIAAALIGICALIVLLVRFWCRSAPACQSSPMAPPAQPQPSSQTMNTNTNKSFWRGAVMVAGVAACVVLTVFGILFLLKKQMMLGPLDSDPSSAGANWFSGAKGAGSASVDFNEPATKGGCDFVLSNTSNTVVGVENHAFWRCPIFSLGSAAGGARPITLSFAYRLDDPVAAGNNLRVHLCFFDSTGTIFLGGPDIDVGARTGDSAMTSYRTLTINGILAPPKARMIYIDLLANPDPNLRWISGTGRFDNISVTTTPHSLLFRAGVAGTAFIGFGALIMLLVRFWRRSAPALPSSPVAPPTQSQPSIQPNLRN